MSVKIQHNYLTVETEFTYLRLSIPLLLGVDISDESHYVRIYTLETPSLPLIITCHDPSQAKALAATLRATVKEAHGRGGAAVVN